METVYRLIYRRVKVKFGKLNKTVGKCYLGSLNFEKVVLEGLIITRTPRGLAVNSAALCELNPPLQHVGFIFCEYLEGGLNLICEDAELAFLLINNF